MVKEHPIEEFKRPKVWQRIDPSRSVGIDLLSHKVGKELNTTLIAMDFQNTEYNTVENVVDFDHPITTILEYLSSIKDDDGN